MRLRYTKESSGPETRRVRAAEALEVDYEDDYENWTKDELQTELEARGLPKTGNKPDLIQRLEDDDDLTV